MDDELPAITLRTSPKMKGLAIMLAELMNRRQTNQHTSQRWRDWHKVEDYQRDLIEEALTVSLDECPSGASQHHDWQRHYIAYQNAMKPLLNAYITDLALKEGIPTIHGGSYFAAPSYKDFCTRPELRDVPRAGIDLKKKFFEHTRAHRLQFEFSLKAQGRGK